MTDGRIEFTTADDGMWVFDGQGTSELSSSDLVRAIVLLGAKQSRTGVRITGARLVGNAAWLRLELRLPLEFDACEFLDEMDLSHASLAGVSFVGCRFMGCGLTFAKATVSEDLVVSRCEAGWIDLARTQVGGDISLDNLVVGSGARGDSGQDRAAVDLSKIQAEDVRIAGVTVGGRLALFEAVASEIHIGPGLIGSDRTNTHPKPQPASVSLATSAPTKYATLWLSQVQVRNGVRLCPGLTVLGDVRFVDAVIGRSLRLGVDTDWAKRHEGGTHGTPAVVIDGGYLNLLRAQVGNRTEIRVKSASPARLAPHMILNDSALGDVTIHEPCIGNGSGLVSLDGATYTYLGVEAPLYLGSGRLSDLVPPELALVREFASAQDPTPGADAQDRLYRAQPYRQLSSSWASAGKFDKAKSALIWMHRDARRLARKPWYARVWSWITDVTVRFGYSVARAAVPLIVAVILAFAVVMAGKGSDQFVAVEPGTAVENVRISGASGPAQEDVILSATSSSECTPYYPCMQPLVYTLDVLVPITDFRQAAYWQPKGDWQGRSWLVVLTVTAWLATTVLVSGIASVARRDHESPHAE